MKLDLDSFTSKSAEFKKIVSVIQSNVEKVKEEIRRLEKDKDHLQLEDLKSYKKFVEYFEPFIVSASRKQDELDQNLRSVNRHIVKVREVYGLSSSYGGTEILALIHSLVTKLQMQIYQIEKEKEKVKRQQMLEEKRKKAAPSKQNTKIAPRITRYSNMGGRQTVKGDETVPSMGQGEIRRLNKREGRSRQLKIPSQYRKKNDPEDKENDESSPPLGEDPNCKLVNGRIRRRRLAPGMSAYQRKTFNRSINYSYT